MLEPDSTKVTRWLSDPADTMTRYVIGGPIADGDTAPEQQ